MQINRQKKTNKQTETTAQELPSQPIVAAQHLVVTNNYSLYVHALKC